jgi:hypothetical protein
MTIVEQMVEEIRTDLANGQDLEDIRDRAGEYVDGYLPIYYNQIVEEWKEMPSEYNDRGSAELGEQQGQSIYDLMSLDLYIYYRELFEEALTEVEESLEGTEA